MNLQKTVKLIVRVLSVLFLGLIVYAGWVKYNSLGYEDGGPPLAIRWEGFYHDMNLRDIGSSMNQCLGEPVFRPDVVLRSASWFSGWNCDKVDNPDVLYSLNYSPEKRERFFCHTAEGRNVSRYFNPDLLLKDLEFLESWSDEETRLASCRFLKDMFVSILEDQKILLHCDAGRDRTGTFTALLLGISADIRGQLDEKMLDAIECDYRKTESLTADKHGRMKAFLQQLQARGGVARFVEQTCEVPPGVIHLIAEKLMPQR